MLAPVKFATALVSGFAVIALLLAVVGLYGVIAYAVSQRTREIGVRIALGAEPKDIARLVLVRGAVLVGAGLLGGIALSTAGSRVLHAYLYGVSERDPLTYTAIVLLLGAVALLAAYLPARRAMRVDPVVALSAE
jgi:putative ABC transport system permease protein